MPFSVDVKEELSRVSCDRQCCALSEITAMVLVGGGLSFKGFGRYGLEIATESNSVARRYYTMLRRWLNAGSEIRVAKTKQLGEHTHYTVQPNREDIPALLDTLDLLNEREPFGMRVAPEKSLLDRSCCVTAFLRGAFLAGGSLNNPEHAYHLEIAVSDEKLSAFVQKAFSKAGISAKRTTRKSQQVVYVKSGEAIADFLALTGASRGRLDFEEIRMNKELRNSINRQMNCDNSNLDKAVLASERHRSIIETIQKEIGLDQLDQQLQEIAELRMKFPAASLAELGSMTEPEITKSGVAARLRKLEAIAEELANG